MTWKLLIAFFTVSINVLSQKSLTKEVFFKYTSSFPKNYKTIIEHPKGWKAMGIYNFYYDKVELANKNWQTHNDFTSFRNGRMFSKIRGKKTIGRGDKRAVQKIVFVSSDTLIIEDRVRQKIKGQEKKVKIRTLYIIE